MKECNRWLMIIGIFDTRRKKLGEPNALLQDSSHGTFRRTDWSHESRSCELKAATELLVGDLGLHNANNAKRRAFGDDVSHSRKRVHVHYADLSACNMEEKLLKRLLTPSMTLTSTR